MVSDTKIYALKHLLNWVYAHLLSLLLELLLPSAKAQLGSKTTAFSQWHPPQKKTDNWWFIQNISEVHFCAIVTEPFLHQDLWQSWNFMPSFFHPLSKAIFHFPGDEIIISLEGGLMSQPARGCYSACIWLDRCSYFSLFLHVCLTGISQKLCLATPSQQDVKMNSLYLYYN